MSQYISENTQRFFQTTYQYSVPQSNYFVVQPQKNQPPRQASLNRNNSVSSSLILKSGKIQQNMGGKLRRENSMKNSMEFKENDSFAKNSHLPGHINKVPFSQKDQNDYGSEYDPKNSYCNPLIVKREKISKDYSRQKIPNYQQTRQNVAQNGKNSQIQKNSSYQQQYELLSQKIAKMQNQIKDNSSSITEHKIKIQKFEEFYQSENAKNDQTRRHSRSISSNNSATPTFKELSDIMGLIEESKNYQIKNSEEYRKMIEQFRSTILQFREQLNKTAKKHDVDSQIQKMKETLFVSGQPALSRKPSVEYSASHAFLIKSKQLETIEKIERQVSTLRNSIDKLQESNTSIKADLVKFNVRDKKASDEIQHSIVQVNRKLQNLEKQNLPLFNENQLKRRSKYEGAPICFKVSHQLIAGLNENRKPQSSQGLAHSSVVQYEQGSKIPLPPKQCLTLNQKTYYIDKDGYLLDKDNYYLLNDKNQQIKLSEKEIQTLKKLNVLQ